MFKTILIYFSGGKEVHGDTCQRLCFYSPYMFRVIFNLKFIFLHTQVFMYIMFGFHLRYYFRIFHLQVLYFPLIYSAVGWGSLSFTHGWVPDHLLMPGVPAHLFTCWLGFPLIYSWVGFPLIYSAVGFGSRSFTHGWVPAHLLSYWLGFPFIYLAIGLGFR